MEDQAEKMEALKKAYAEIILNTAKEAAARAMASDRKALRFHHDLQNTKDEALRMLLRYKEMIGVKKIETETTALSQQKRIKELDVRLNETEGVIVDLREKIRKAHERLEEMKNSNMLQSNGPSENEHMHQENTDVTEQFRCSSECSKSCDQEKDITTSGPNLASIISNKEPELYRNGYTHRIRAIDRNTVDEKNISEEKELIINLDEKKSGKCVPLSIDTENKDKKNINRSEAFSINSRVAKDQTVKTQRIPKSVRFAQSNHKFARFCHEKLNLKEKSCGKDAKLTENHENSACTLRRSIRKRKVRCWDEISSLFKSRAAISRCKADASKEIKCEDTKLLNDSVESAAKESARVACDTENNRCLKYTFSRRRKKVLSSKSDNCSSFLTGQMREKPRLTTENDKPNLAEDSSSDSQNIIDVACQLISLSGKCNW